MIPILYAKGASAFDNNGIGHLKDAISCKVSEERNGAYTLTLQYPTGGAWYESISEGSIIKAKANETSDLQLFRVYKSSKPMKGVVTFYAEHISYDLKGLPLALLSMTDTTAEAALNSGFAACFLPHGFTGRSDITTLNKINITKPRSLRNFCGGEAGSVLSIWGGEFEFDNFTVWLHKHRGANNGVVIRYGKNLTDAKQERNISACYTHFCPYAIEKTETRNGAGEVIESNEETITLPEGVIELINPENIGHSRALTLDISDKFTDDEEINAENLRTHAEEYIKSHKLGVPDVNITLSFMQIWDSPEYAQSAGFERVALCDTVTVLFEDLGINAEAKIIKTEYDSLEERFSKIEVGNAKSTLSDTVSGIKESIRDTNESLAESEKSASLALQNAIERATNSITGNSGGYVVLSPANNPQEILIMDAADKATATRVWRWNSAGLGYSKNGYNGTYGLAMTMDGEIVADYITAGTLKAINVSGCTITGGSLNINDKFTVDTEGNVRTEGYIVATGGIIGGCEIVDGKLVIGSANITGKLTASQIDASELKVSAANITGDLIAKSIVNSTENRSPSETGAKQFKIEGALAYRPETLLRNSISDSMYSNIYNSFYNLETRSYNHGVYDWETTPSAISRIATGIINTYNTNASGWRDDEYGSNVQTLPVSMMATYKNIDENTEYLIYNQEAWASLWLRGGNVYLDGETCYISTKRKDNENYYYGSYITLNQYNGTAEIGSNYQDNNKNNSVYITFDAEEEKITASTPITTISDIRLKKDIDSDLEKYSKLFNEIRPVKYKYRRENSGLYHIGFIAQEVEKAILAAGLTRKDFAALCVLNEGTDKESWGLRYEEFIAILTYEIQKLKAELSELKQKIII